MSVRIPILVNDQCVGSMMIVRIIDGLSQAELDNDKRTHEYRWEIIEDRPHETRRATGTCWHRPCEGIWRLAEKAMEQVPVWAESR